MECSTSRDSYKYAFCAAEKLSCCKSVIVFYRNDFIVNICIKNVRNKACADTLNLV